MKRSLFLTGVMAALLGCGSGLPTAPALPTFSYGTPTANLSPEQSSAMATGRDALRSASGANGQNPDPTAAPALADELGANLPASAMLVAPSPQAALLSLPVPSSDAARAVRSAALNVDTSSCVAHNGNTYSYNGCSYSGGGFSWTLNGSITVAAAAIDWNIQATFSGSGDGVSGSGQGSWTGHLAWTATTVTGNGLSQFAAKLDGNGQHAELGETSGWKADLSIDPSLHCINGGTLEVARAVEGSGSNGQHVSTKAGWKFTWSDCNNVMVAVGT